MSPQRKNKIKIHKIKTAPTPDAFKGKVPPRANSGRNGRRGDPSRKKRSGLIGWLAIFATLLVATLAINGIMFYSAFISVSPVWKIISPKDIKKDMVFFSYKEAFKGDFDGEKFYYDIATFEETAHVGNYEIIGEINNDNKPVAEVVLMNFLPSEQTLLPFTRLKDDSGNVYKINESKTVKIPPGSDEKPGELKTEIFLAESVAGEKTPEEGDILRLPGWKESGNDEKYEKQYAIVKREISPNTAPVDEGDISESDRKKLLKGVEGAISELKKALSEDIEAYAKSLKDSIVLYNPDDIVIDDDYVVSDINKKTDPPIKSFGVTARMAVAVLEMDDVEKYLSDGVAWTDIPQTVYNIGNIEFELNESSRVAKDAYIKFRPTSNILFVPKMDADKIRNAIAGADRQSISEILREVAPEINRYTLKIYPFWKLEVPEDKSRINVDIIYPDGRVVDDN